MVQSSYVSWRLSKCNVNRVKRGGMNQTKNKGGKFDKRQETKKTTEGKMSTNVMRVAIVA